MRAQVSVELLLLIGIMAIVSIGMFGSFLVFKSDIDPETASASIYQFYQKIYEHKRLALHSCSNYKYNFNYSFAVPISIEHNSNYISSDIGQVYFNGVRFLTGNRIINSSKLNFNITCINYELQVIVE
ncbi:MAG: hypothetical protein QXL02_02245 [Candidatus Anstonellales archaeon]